MIIRIKGILELITVINDWRFQNLWGSKLHLQPHNFPNNLHIMMQIKFAYCSLIYSWSVYIYENVYIYMKMQLSIFSQKCLLNFLSSSKLPVRGSQNSLACFLMDRDSWKIKNSVSIFEEMWNPVFAYFRKIEKLVYTLNFYFASSRCVCLCVLDFQLSKLPYTWMVWDTEFKFGTPM